MPLQWSEPQEPCEACRYDHVVAQTPLGLITIEWKGWKDYPGYTCILPWGEPPEFVAANDLPGAKCAVQSAWDVMAERVSEMRSR